MMNDEHEAQWYRQLDGLRTECLLCPRRCVIGPGATGLCGVRRNEAGILYSLAYGHPAAVAVDPIEKKPLREFLPGSRAFSVGTLGCNLLCSFCQNSGLSRKCYDSEVSLRYVSPEQLVDAAERHRCASVAYTYNEPGVFGEYLMDIAVLARARGLKNVLVSNGFLEEGAARDIYSLIDAANIDMKGFSEDFYRRNCGGSLQPVLAGLELLYHLGVHLEITNLVIPGENDSEEMIDGWLDWVEAHLDRQVPLHFSAYFPAWKMKIPATPPETLYAIRRKAWNRGFTAVYLGNIF